MSDDLSINLSHKDIYEMVKNTIGKSIEQTLQSNKANIDKSISKYFERGIFNGRESQFENAVDWAIEMAFRDGINKAMEELKFTELIANKAKEMLIDGDYIHKLADKKIRMALGLQTEG